MFIVSMRMIHGVQEDYWGLLRNVYDLKGVTSSNLSPDPLVAAVVVGYAAFSDHDGQPFPR